MKNKDTKKDKEESVESSLENIRDPKLKASAQRMYEKFKAGNIGNHAEKMANEIQNAIAPGGKLPDEQMHIPYIPMPTDMCRVSPFFPLARQKLKERSFVRDIIITNSSWGDITYTGPELSTYEEDVLMSVLALLDKAENRQLEEIGGKKTYTYRGPLLPVLTKMGYKRVGSTDYDHVLSALELMSATCLTLKVYKRTTRGKRKISKWLITNMISAGYWDEKKKELVVTVNPYFYENYMAGTITLIDVESRSKLKSPIAKCLYRFIQSHRAATWEGNYFTLAGSLNLDRDQPYKELKRYIKRAISVLVRHKILSSKSGFKNKETVKLIRHPSIVTR